MGIIAGAMEGLGAGMAAVGRQGADYLARSSLQAEMAEIQRLRDERLNEFARQNIEHAEDLRRKPAREAAAEIEKKKGEFVDDLSGTVRQRTRPEMAEVEESAYRRQGLVTEAQGVREGEERRQERAETRLDRGQDRALRERQVGQQDEQIALEERKVKALETTAGFDARQKKAIEDARDAYLKATDPEEKQKAGATYLTLLGKTGERYKEIYETDVDGTKRIVAFFDTLSGKELRRGGAATPSPDDIDGLRKRAGDARAVAFFEQKFGQGSAKRYLDMQRPAPGKPEPPGAQIVDTRHDQELKTRTNWGRLSPEADLQRAIKLGNPHAKAEAERRKRAPRNDAEARRRSTGELETP